MISAASFDVLGTDVIYAKVYNFKPRQSFNNVFEEAGFGDSNFIENMGTLYILGIGFFSSTGTIVLVLWLSKKYNVFRCISNKY